VLDAKEILVTRIELFDYVKKNGLSMPSRERVNGEDLRLEVATNVKIKPGFFSTAPRLSDGPTPWEN
jgi:hypothetical protein